MKKNEAISHVMQPIDQLSVVHLDQKLSTVRQILADQKTHHVPVLHGKKLVGLLSATDMLKMTFTAYGGDERAFDAYLDHEFSIEGVMTRSVITLTEKQTVRDAAELLAQGTFHALPVINDRGDCVGMVTSTDLINHLRHLYD